MARRSTSDGAIEWAAVIEGCKGWGIGDGQTHCINAVELEYSTVPQEGLRGYLDEA